MRLHKLLPRCALLGGMALFLATSFPAQAVPVRVMITNLAPTNGNFLTPMWVGFHDGTFDLYDSGSPISAALERLAEDGTTGNISAAFLAFGAGTIDGAITGSAGPIAPGETTFMAFDLNPAAMSNRYFSYASMVIPSNDAFIANGNPLAHPIFSPGGMFLGADFIIAGSMVLDAGSEVNDEIPGNTAFFGQAAPNTGTPQNGTVQNHPGFIPGGPILSTPMFANADFEAPGYQVARIQVEVVPEPGTILLMAGGLAGLFWLRRRKAA